MALDWLPIFPDLLPRPEWRSSVLLRAEIDVLIVPIHDSGRDNPVRIFPMRENSSGRYTARFTTGDGVTGFTGLTLTALYLTVYARQTDDSILFLRPRENVLLSGRAHLSSDRLVWDLTSQDTAQVTGQPFETHYAIFEWVWAGGRGKRLIAFVVEALAQVA